uniref:ABC transporter permease n=1 Tax=Meloidogyne hapla TaxID=6305 RepID=A0A1I8AZQ5_MELHA
MKECSIFLFIGGFLIQFVYVISINTFYDHKKPRDYIQNVRKRFIVAFLNNFVGIIVTYKLIGLFYVHPFIHMGFRSNNLFFAILFPSLLTLIFYLGTIITLIIDGNIQIKGFN